LRTLTLLTDVSPGAFVAAMAAPCFAPLLAAGVVDFCVLPPTAPVDGCVFVCVCVFLLRARPTRLLPRPRQHGPCCMADRCVAHCSGLQGRVVPPRVVLDCPPPSNRPLGRAARPCLLSSRP
jgi:hypothetical protein